MRAGWLRKKAAIQADVGTTTNTSGEHVPDWQTATYARCSLWPVSGDERQVIQKVTPEVTHKVRMRYGAVVTACNRLVIDGRTFQIVFVFNVKERNVELELLCKERC